MEAQKGFEGVLTAKKGRIGDNGNRRKVTTTNNFDNDDHNR